MALDYLAEVQRWHSALLDEGVLVDVVDAEADLSGYDADYIWLAAELKAPLATFDRKLATAAKAHLASLP